MNVALNMTGDNNLTLTSVVFELGFFYGFTIYLLHLTLTSVVFEFYYYYT